MIVVGAVERRRFEGAERVHRGRRFYAGRIRMRVMGDTTGATLTDNELAAPQNLTLL